MAPLTNVAKDLLDGQVLKIRNIPKPVLEEQALAHERTASKDFVQCETHSKQGHSSQINTVVRESAEEQSGFKNS